MYFPTHVAISATVPAVLVLAAGSPLSFQLIATSVVGGVVIDLVDHSVYQARFLRARPDLRAAWRGTLSRDWRQGLRSLAEIEDSRSVNALILHSRAGLVLASIAAIALTVWFDSVLVAAVSLTYLLSMHCDIVWDWKQVGHAQNWFGRASMWGTRSPSIVYLWLRNFRSIFTALYFSVFFVASEVFFLARGTGLSSVTVWAVQVPAVWVTAYICSIAISAYVSIRWARINGVSVRFLEARFKTDPRRRTRISWMRHTGHFLRVNHLLVAIGTTAVIATEVVVMMDLATEGPSLKIAVLDNATMPFLTAVIVLATSLPVTYFLHSTGGALGGLMGAAGGAIASFVIYPNAIGPPGNVVLSTVLMSSIISWVLGILFLRIPGAKRSSFSLLSIQISPATVATLQLSTLRDVVGAEMAQLKAKMRLPDKNPSIQFGQPKDRLMHVDGLAVDILVDGRIDNRSIEFEPRNLESWAPLLRTFTTRTDLCVPWLPARTQPADNSKREKNLSEILDSLFTVRAKLVIEQEICAVIESATALVQIRAYEETSTKAYATAYSDECIEAIGSALARRLPKTAAIVRTQFKVTTTCPHLLGDGVGSVVSTGQPAHSDLSVYLGVTTTESIGRSQAQRTGRKISAILVQAISVGAAVAKLAQLIR